MIQRFRRVVQLMVLLLLGMILSGPQAAWGAVTAEQKQAAKSLEAAVTKAGGLYKDGKFKEAGDIVRESQAKLEKFVEEGGKDVVPLAESIYSRLLKAHALLELEGIELPELKKPEAPTTGTPSGPGPSFVKDAAPILMSKCGRCHVNDAKGMFSMSSFAALMKGPMEGVVIFPGDAEGSRIIEVIESGDMPRGGLKVTPQELATLKKWIKAGAKFDGDDPQTNLASLVKGATPSELPQLGVKQATGKETVSFLRDVAPILIDNCTGCHINPMRASGNFNMTTFQGFLRGGDGGAPIEPGKPDDSLLIKKLQGKAGDRMPRGKPPLADDVIAKIATWIKEGAAFDGMSPQQNVVEGAAIAKANASTHDQLSADRLKLSVDNWQLGMPGIKSEQIETEHFVIMGNFGEATLNEYGKTAEKVAPEVAELFKSPANSPLVKGRMTLFFFSDRYSYNEFGKMVERRDIPKEYRGHWRYTIVDAYGAIIPPKAEESSLPGLVAQQIAGVYVASLGKSPHWFAEGAARAAAAKIDTNDPRVSMWDSEVLRILSGLSKPAEILSGKLPPEEADIASYSFVRFLMRDAKRFDALLNAVRNGKDFDKSFAQIYNGTPVQVTDFWAVAATKAKPTKRPNKKSKD